MKEKIGKIGIVLISVLCFSSLTYLFWAQANYHDGTYQADLYAHMLLGVSNTYRYNLVYRILGFLWQHDGSARLIGIFLAGVCVLTVYWTKRLIVKFYPDMGVKAYYLAYMLNFCMSLYFPLLNKYHYLSNIGPLLLHNSTYICMKLCLLIMLEQYIDLKRQLLEHIDWKKYILFILSMILLILTKPNFFLCFAPAVFIELMIILCRKDALKAGFKWKRVLLAVCTTIPVFIIMLYQSKVMFSDGGSKITIDFGYALFSWAEYPVIGIIQSLAFPLYILVTNFREVKKDEWYRLSITTAGFGLFEYLFLIESGVRLNDLNWIWGYAGALFVLYIASFLKWYERRKEKNRSVVITNYIPVILLIWHFLSGVDYFIVLLTGGKFF